MSYYRDQQMWSLSDILLGKIKKRLEAGYDITSIRLTLNEFNRLCAEHGYLQREEFPEEEVYFRGYPVKEKTW